MTADPKWEWSADDIRRVGYRIVDVIAKHVTTLPSRPVFQPVPQNVVRELAGEPVPSGGQTPDEIVDTFLHVVEPYPFGNGHPRFFGWVNSPPVMMQGRLHNTHRGSTSGSNASTFT